MYHHIQGKMADRSTRPPDETEMRTLAEHLARITGSYNMSMATCAEKIDLSDLGIDHGKCIDDYLIAELTGVNLKIAKDKNQRELCGCVTSVDIGEYNTCRHLCSYCYANSNQKKREKNYALHHSKSPLLIGDNSLCKSQ
jgi:hypothetical protein